MWGLGRVGAGVGHSDPNVASSRAQIDKNLSISS